MKLNKIFCIPKLINYPTKGTAIVLRRMVSHKNAGFDLKFEARASGNVIVNSQAGHFDEARWVFEVIEDDEPYKFVGLNIVITSNATLLSGGDPALPNASYAGLYFSLTAQNSVPPFEYVLDRKSTDGYGNRIDVKKHSFLPLLPRPREFSLKLDLTCNVVLNRDLPSWAKVEARVQMVFTPFVCPDY